MASEVAPACNGARDHAQCSHPSLDIAQCDPAVVTLRGNRYYTTTGNATMTCGNTELTLAGAQTRGIEQGSSSEKIPEAKQILAWAHSMLGM